MLVIGFTAYSHAQLWSGVLSPNRAIDWTTAGTTIQNRTTVCTTLSAGASAAQINSAIASCPSGQVVYLNAGTYNLSSGIIFSNKSNVTLRGAGADQTNLVFSAGNSCNGQGADICIMNGDLNWVGGPTNTANWTGGYSKGSTSLTLDNTSNLAVGSVIILDQLNDATDPGTVNVCETAGTCSAEGPAGGERTNRAQQQMVTVTGVSGNTVSISPGIYMPNWRTSQAPGAWWANTQASGDGIENLTVNSAADTGSLSGIVFFNTNNCWIKGATVLNTNRNHVWLYQTIHATIRDSYFYGTLNAAAQSYGIESYVSSDNLIENNIFQHVVSPTVMNGSASGTTVGYNYSINDYYSLSAGWMMGQDWLHAAGIDNVLYEGNEGAGLTSDTIHGSHHFVTAFRNQFTGWETGKTAQTVPVNIYAHSRYYNVIGNVLGTSGYHNNYVSADPNGTSPDTSIYDLGWGDSDGAPADTLVQPTIMMWGNYDTVNAAARFVGSEVPSGLSIYANPVPSSNTLPASLYHTSTPSWWTSGKAWPAIGPDVTGGNISNLAGHAYTIPAQDCYTKTMGGPADGSGNALTFNASNCYSSSTGGSTAPAPPSNLTVTVK
jgi:hypothetical protein